MKKEVRDLEVRIGELERKFAEEKRVRNTECVFCVVFIVDMLNVIKRKLDDSLG